MEPWTLEPGNAPLIVNVPHAGVFIPQDIAVTLTPQALRVPDTDWHVDRLYRDLASVRGITMMCATHSRIVVDLNRDPSGAALYPGASNTEICPTTTFHDEAHYLEGLSPDATAIAKRVGVYWQPYHTTLAEQIDRVLAAHGYCLLLDAHSIASVVPRFFAGCLSDLNLGTADGQSAAAEVAQEAFSVLENARGFTAVHNGRFKGGYITRHYGQPERGVHALQLEISQACYLDESNPVEFPADRAQALQSVLARLLDALIGWHPA
jgi:N-formylglutamate amidohydrolase